MQEMLEWLIQFVNSQSCLFFFCRLWFVIAEVRLMAPQSRSVPKTLPEEQQHM